MKRTFVATALVLLLAVATTSQQDPKSDPVLLTIGKDKDITVTIPYVNRKQLNEMVGNFFAGESKVPSEELVRRIAEASDVTLIITTKKLERVERKEPK